MSHLPLEAWVGALTAAGLLAFAAPAPRRPLPAAGPLCAALLVAGVMLATAGIALLLFDRWLLGAELFVLGTVVGLPTFWVARSPEDRSDADDGLDEGGGGGGGGGGPRRRPPEPTPPGPPAPPTLDWDAFERARAEWERPTVAL